MGGLDEISEGIKKKKYVYITHRHRHRRRCGVSQREGRWGRGRRAKGKGTERACAWGAGRTVQCADDVLLS